MGWSSHPRARLLPAVAAEVLLNAFFVLEGRLRQGEQARSFQAGAMDRGTTTVLAVAYGIAGVGAPAAATLRRGRLPLACGGVGVALMTGGLALRVWSARVLGPSYTRTLRVRSEQAVVDTGPYGWVRHPGYAGVLATWLGFGVAWTSLPAVVVALGPILAAYVRRIAVEEAMLEERIGQAYRQYQARTARLIPKVY